MPTDSRLILATVIVFATMVGAWMFRYEPFNTFSHRNRFTGATCDISEECWFGANGR